MGIFNTDPIITSNGGTPAPSTPSTPSAPASSTDVCIDPGSGLPKYDRIVLESLHGDGFITRAQYRAVVAGTKSIEDLDITPAQLARLRCDGSSEVSLYDIHFDPEYPPYLTPSVAAGFTVAWTVQHKPTDKAHRISVTTPAGGAIAPSAVAHIDFGNQYVDDDGLAVAPIVTVTPAGGSETWRAANVTSTGYDLISDSGVGPAMTAVVQVLVEPARR